MTAPQPQLPPPPPSAKKQSAHGEQGSARLCWGRTPCPGTHVQFLRLMAANAEVFLSAWLAFHSLLQQRSRGRTACMVGGALYAGLLGLVGEAALAVGTGGAGQALRQQLEAGAGDAVLDDGLACLVESARVRRAGSALQVGCRVLEGVDRTFDAEAREVAATELASGAGATRVRRSLVAESADTVAAVGAPRQHEGVSVEHEQLVRRPSVVGEAAGLAGHVSVHEEVAGRTEHTVVVRVGGLQNVLGTDGAALRRAVLVAGEALAVGEVVHDEQTRPNEVLVLAAEGRTSNAVRSGCHPSVLRNEVVKEGVAVLCAGCTAVRAVLVVFVLLKQPRHALVTLENSSAHIPGLVSELADVVQHRD